MQKNNEELLSLLVSATRINKALNDKKDLKLLVENKNEVYYIEKLVDVEKDIKTVPAIKKVLNSRKILTDQLEYNKKSNKSANIIKMYKSAVDGIDEALRYLTSTIRFYDKEKEEMLSGMSMYETHLKKCRKFLNLFGYPFAYITIIEDDTIKFIELNKEHFDDMSADRIINLNKMIYDMQDQLNKVPETLEEFKTYKKELK
jgi:hypothetical protein